MALRSSGTDAQFLRNMHPKDGDAIQGTGGLRKIRIPMENKGKGKRGGARVIYVDIEIKEIIYFINVYTKLVDCLEKCLIYRHIRRFAD